MTPIYMVVWSGGYDAPSYQVFTDAEKAEGVAGLWAAEMDDGDWVDLLRIDVDVETVTRINVACPHDGDRIDGRCHTCGELLDDTEAFDEH